LLAVDELIIYKEPYISQKQALLETQVRSSQSMIQDMVDALITAGPGFESGDLELTYLIHITCVITHALG
jgi:hypothetical protein